MLAAVFPNPALEGARANYRSSGKPTSVRSREVSPRLALDTPTDPIPDGKRRKTRATSERPTRGTNVPIVYSRLAHAEEAGPASEGDIVFVHRLSTLFGASTNRLSRVATWRDVNRMLADKSNWLCPGDGRLKDSILKARENEMKAALFRMESIKAEIKAVENARQKVSADLGVSLAEAECVYEEKLAALGEAKLPGARRRARKKPVQIHPATDWRAVPALADWRPDGALKSTDAARDLLGDAFVLSHAEVLHNIVVQGPAPVRSSARGSGGQLLAGTAGDEVLLLLVAVYEPLGCVRFELKPTTRSAAIAVADGGSAQLGEISMGDLLNTAVAWRIGTVVDTRAAQLGAGCLSVAVDVELVTRDSLWHRVSAPASLLESSAAYAKRLVCSLSAREAERARREAERARREGREPPDKSKVKASRLSLDEAEQTARLLQSEARARIAREKAMRLAELEEQRRRAELEEQRRRAAAAPAAAPEAAPAVSPPVAPAAAALFLAQALAVLESRLAEIYKESEGLASSELDDALADANARVKEARESASGAEMEEASRLVQRANASVTRADRERIEAEGLVAAFEGGRAASPEAAARGAFLYSAQTKLATKRIQDADELLDRLDALRARLTLEARKDAATRRRITPGAVSESEQVRRETEELLGQQEAERLEAIDYEDSEVRVVINRRKALLTAQLGKQTMALRMRLSLMGAARLEEGPSGALSLTSYNQRDTERVSRLLVRLQAEQRVRDSIVLALQSSRGDPALVGALQRMQAEAMFLGYQHKFEWSRGRAQRAYAVALKTGGFDAGQSGGVPALAPPQSTLPEPNILAIGLRRYAPTPEDVANFKIGSAFVRAHRARNPDAGLGTRVPTVGWQQQPSEAGAPLGLNNLQFSELVLGYYAAKAGSESHLYGSLMHHSMCVQASTGRLKALSVGSADYSTLCSSLRSLGDGGVSHALCLMLAKMGDVVDPQPFTAGEFGIYQLRFKLKIPLESLIKLAAAKGEMKNLLRLASGSTRAEKLASVSVAFNSLLDLPYHTPWTTQDDGASWSRSTEDRGMWELSSRARANALGVAAESSRLTGMTPMAAVLSFLAISTRHVASGRMALEGPPGKGESAYGAALSLPQIQYEDRLSLVPELEGRYTTQNSTLARFSQSSLRDALATLGTDAEDFPVAVEEGGAAQYPIHEGPGAEIEEVKYHQELKIANDTTGPAADVAPPAEAGDWRIPGVWAFGKLYGLKEYVLGDASQDGELQHNQVFDWWQMKWVDEELEQL